MPFYVGGGLGPLRYYHRLGRRARGQRRPARVHDWSPAAQRAQLAAGLVILAVCAAVIVAMAVAAL